MAPFGDGLPSELSVPLAAAPQAPGGHFFVYLVNSAECLLWGQRGLDTALTSEEAAG